MLEEDIARINENGRKVCILYNPSISRFEILKKYGII